MLRATTGGRSSGPCCSSPLPWRRTSCGWAASAATGSSCARSTTTTPGWSWPAWRSPESSSWPRAAPSLRVPTAAAGGVLAAQLAGTGLVAFRRWVPVGGFGPGEWDNIGQLRLLSALLVLCGVAAVVACLVSLRAEAALPVRVPWTSRSVALCAGLLVVVALPGRRRRGPVRDPGRHVPRGARPGLLRPLRSQPRPHRLAQPTGRPSPPRLRDAQRARAHRREPSPRLDPWAHQRTGARPGHLGRGAPRSGRLQREHDGPAVARLLTPRAGQRRHGQSWPRCRPGRAASPPWRRTPRDGP